MLAAPIADRTATQDAAFTFTLPAGSFTDPDIDIASGDSLSYGARLASGAALPSWLTFDAATQTFSGTPANADVGSLAIRVTATDSFGLKAQGDFRLDVANVNDTPVLAVPIAGQAATQGAAFAFALPAGTFTDPDIDIDIASGDALSYSARLTSDAELPSWLKFDAATQRFSGTPANADVGSLAIRVTATDHFGLKAHGDFRLDVANVNDTPVLAAPIADQAAVQGVSFAFTLPARTFTDPDIDIASGDSLSYTARLASGAALPSWLAFDAAKQTFTGTPAAGNVGSVVVHLTATDRSGAEAHAQFTLTVVAPAMLPVETAVAVATATAAAPVPAALPAAVAAVAPARPAPPAVVETVVPEAAPILPDDASAVPKFEITAEPPRRAGAADVLVAAATTSRADSVLASAIVPQFANLSALPLGALLASDDLLRKFEEVQRQMQQQSSEHRTAVASSVALTGGVSIGYAMWLVRGGVLASSMLSALPAWQMVDPLPVLASARGGRKDRHLPDDPEVERLFDRGATPPAAPAAPAAPTLPAAMPAANASTPMHLPLETRP